MIVPWNGTKQLLKLIIHSVHGTFVCGECVFKHLCDFVRENFQMVQKQLPSHAHSSTNRRHSTNVSVLQFLRKQELFIKSHVKSMQLFEQMNRLNATHTHTSIKNKLRFICIISKFLLPILLAVYPQAAKRLAPGHYFHFQYAKSFFFKLLFTHTKVADCLHMLLCFCFSYYCSIETDRERGWQGGDGGQEDGRSGAKWSV